MHKNKTYSRFIKFYFPILSFIKNRKFKKSIKKRYLLCESVEDLNTKSQVFCMAPWVHFHLLPNGIVTPCCLTPYHIAFGNAHDKKLIKIWNSSRFRKLRKQMLAGIKSDICNECYGYESVNKHSFRMYFNSTYRNEFKLVKSTHSSGYLDKMNIRYFDVRFSNLCNFKCRGCGPDLSSSWQGDSEKLFDRKPATLHVVNCTEKGSNHIWEQLTTFIPNVHELFFAGGEPLLMEEHYKALDILLKNGRKDATISYVTNLSTLQFKQYNLFDLWKNFKKLNINVSVDDIEKEGNISEKEQNGII